MTKTSLQIFRGDTVQILARMPNGNFATGSANLTLRDAHGSYEYTFTPQPIPAGASPLITFTAPSSVTTDWAPWVLQGQVRACLGPIKLVTHLVEVVTHAATTECAAAVLYKIYYGNIPTASANETLIKTLTIENKQNAPGTYEYPATDEPTYELFAYPEFMGTFTYTSAGFPFPVDASNVTIDGAQYKVMISQLPHAGGLLVASANPLIVT